MATLKEHVARHDREIAAIRKLIHAGMKMIVRVEANLDQLATSQLKLDTKLDRLAASQRETDRQLKEFIRSLRRGGDGRVSGNVHP